jgi:hypothetical protein
LPRFPPVEPADAVKTFQVRPGFHVELVASEPLIASPIAACFDENGRMFVLEMRDYSEQRDVTNRPSSPTISRGPRDSFGRMAASSSWPCRI